MTVVSAKTRDGKRAFEDWLATASLYKARVFSAGELSDLAALLRADNATFGFDAYCIYCRSNSHFKWISSKKIRHKYPSSMTNPGETDNAYYSNELPSALSAPEFLCARSGYHRMQFFLRLMTDHQKGQMSFTKIGQYPSSFDLVRTRVKIS